MGDVKGHKRRNLLNLCGDQGIERISGETGDSGCTVFFLQGSKSRLTVVLIRELIGKPVGDQTTRNDQDAVTVLGVEVFNEWDTGRLRIANDKQIGAAVDTP